VPELPEVETTVRGLRRRVIGRRIRQVTVLTPATIRSPAPARFTRALRGRRVLGVTRRGKFLVFTLDRDLVLLAHLRMTGDFAFTTPGRPRHPSTRVIFHLNGRDLRFVDTRRFGHMDLLPASAVPGFEPLRRLGVEPLARAFTVDRLREMLKVRRGMLKPLLLRQDVLAGIGNLYADEILFQARLHPGRRVESLRPAEVRRLYLAIRQVLQRGVRGSARPGEPVGRLLDVRETDGPCPRCGAALVSRRLGGRTTYYCPVCQRPNA